MTTMAEAGQPLTPREIEVLRAVAITDTVTEAARILGISRNTLWSHNSAAMAKLNVRTRHGAWAALGWLRVPDLS